MQPLSDGLKLLQKKLLSQVAQTWLYLFLLNAYFYFKFIRLGCNSFWEGGLVVSDLSLGLLHLFAISSLGVYGIVIAGWSSNSKYSFSTL